jgi:Domain of unknown function (DUF5710)
MTKLILPRFIAKSHVSSYTKKDGTFVAEHDDGRSKLIQPVLDKMKQESAGRDAKKLKDATDLFLTQNGLRDWQYVHERDGYLMLGTPGSGKMAKMLGFKPEMSSMASGGKIKGISAAEFKTKAEVLIEARGAAKHAENKRFDEHQAKVGRPVDKHEAAAAGHAAGRVYLKVPFAEKDGAKSAGAKWDGEAKMWYWPKPDDSLPEKLKKYRTQGAMTGFSS